MLTTTKPTLRQQQEQQLRLLYGLDEHQASKMLDHILGGCDRIEEERRHLARVSRRGGVADEAELKTQPTRVRHCNRLRVVPPVLIPT